MTLEFLRPAQVDALGALNTSRAGSVRFPGGLATADVPTLLTRVVVYHTEHVPRALPPRVEFVTGPPGHVRTIVTDRCVIRLNERGPEVVSVHPGQEVETVRAATGFRLHASARVATTSPPSAEELSVLEAIDPHRLRELEFKATRREAERRLLGLLHEERSTRA